MRALRGFSLTEVMISLLLISLVAVVTLRSYLMANEMSYIEALRSTAVYACQDMIEQILSDDFEDITVDFYPDESPRILDTRGTPNTHSDDVFYSRTVDIIDLSDTLRQQKDVTVTVTFTFNGKTYSEQLVTRVVGAGK